MNHIKFHELFNFLGLCLTCIVLSLAFYLQFSLNELPCPLCLLQRVCFIAAGIALSLNLRFGAKDKYYGLIILACVVGFGISLHQVFLHLGADDKGYGEPVFGLYLYAWAAIGFMVATSLCGIALLFNKPSHCLPPGKFKMTLIGFFSLLILANAISVFIECGPWVCPANPENYYFSPNFA
jgi:disulfide bond formation protein DsbB